MVKGASLLLIILTVELASCFGDVKKEKFGGSVIMVIAVAKYMCDF